MENKSKTNNSDIECVVYANILNGINNNWSILEKAKYIYNQICKITVYDERLIYSQNPELLNSIFNKEVSIDEPILPVLVCKTMNKIYSQLLDRIGIKNKMISKESNINENAKMEDVALILYDEEGKEYFTSLSADIQRCKYGMKTQFFGGCDDNFKEGSRDKVTIIKADKLKEIDTKTGYLQEGGIYSDEIFDMIAKEVKQNNSFRKFLKTNGLRLVVEYLKEQGETEASQLTTEELSRRIDLFNLNEIIKIKMKAVTMIIREKLPHGYIENKKYFIDLFQKAIFNKSERKYYDSFDMIRENNNTIDIVSIIRFNLKPEPIYYIYSDEIKNYRLASLEEVYSIEKEYKTKREKKLVDNQCQEKE